MTNFLGKKLISYLIFFQQFFQKIKQNSTTEKIKIIFSTIAYTIPICSHTYHLQNNITLLLEIPINFVTDLVRTYLPQAHDRTIHVIFGKQDKNEDFHRAIDFMAQVASNDITLDESIYMPYKVTG